MESTESTIRRPWRKRALTLGCAVLALAALLAVAACAPSTPSKNTDEPLADTGSEAVSDEFLESLYLLPPNESTSDDPGPFAAAYNMGKKMNAGNRGCDACHADLQKNVADISPTTHLLSTGPIFGKTIDWNDCEPCHTAKMAPAGISLADPIHNMHLSSDIFNNTYNGTCMSCHATSLEGEMVMYDEYVYTPQAGGYKAIREVTGIPGLEDSTVEYMHGRGYDTDTNIGVNVLNADNVKLDVKLDQAMSSEEDSYTACNYGIPEYSQEEIDNWTIEFTDVKNPQSFTLADLAEKFEKKTFQVTQVCMVNGVNSSQECSFEASGYLIEDIIDYCGGVNEGLTKIKGVGDDSWPFNVSLEESLEHGAFIAVEYYGKDITPMKGYPAVLVQPGFPGNHWVKYLKSVSFGNDPDTFPVEIACADENYKASPTAQSLYPCNSAWFNPARDGATFKVGEPTTLEGYANVMNIAGHSTGAVRFSFDYGATWTTVDVPDDFDDRNWTRFYATWTPERTGTYVLYVEAVDAADGWHQNRPAATIVNVVE